MKKAYKSLIALALFGLLLFAGSVAVYLLNLDLRLIAKIQPLLEPIYDRVERTPMP